MRTRKTGTFQFKNWGVLLFFLLFLFTAGNVGAQTSGRKVNVLFIGNSYTYINSLPQMFKSLVEKELPGVQINVKFTGEGGATMKDHWKNGGALKEIKTGKWNYVVLQGQSMLGSDDLTAPGSPDLFYKYSRKLAGEVKKSGGRAVFFMTWCRKNLPDQQKYLTNAYSKISAECGGILAPVGEVWKEFHHISDIELYRRDNSHPTVTGTYLAALTIFAAIFNEIPGKLPLNLYGHKLLHGEALSPGISLLCNLKDQCVDLSKQAVVKVMDGEKEMTVKH